MNVGFDGFYLFGSSGISESAPGSGIDCVHSGVEVTNGGPEALLEVMRGTECSL